MIVDGGCGLGAEITGFGVEIERADAVVTMRAAKLHAAFDALDFVGFHYVNCKSFAGQKREPLVGQRR